ncbi:MAG: hypothetical protein KDA53_16265 [Hyphomonas sp.]|nr:hypothetical protein [Hyphomonas sp.]
MTYWENGVTASEAVFVGASNDSETTAFRYREGGLWDEVAVPGGETRFTFAETGRDVSAIRLTDASRNGGLSLILDLDRKVVDLQEAPGEPWYVRYTIVAVH